MRVRITKLAPSVALAVFVALLALPAVVGSAWAQETPEAPAEPEAAVAEDAAEQVPEDAVADQTPDHAEETGEDTDPARHTDAEAEDHHEPVSYTHLTLPTN